MAEDELIAGRYRVVARVGSGAMGVVWRAEDERLRRAVALKQVRLPGGVDERSTEQAHQRVIREGRLVARIHHPHAISVFDVVDHDGEPWLVMEYLPSRSLAEVVAEDGALTSHAAAAMGHQVAAALTAAHAAGIVHRDVKPGNVLIGTDGVVKVTDFGISRAVDEATITSTGMMAGTPAYLAPEVARGAAADFRSDVYSLGSTIYAAVEGAPPFGTGENPLALLHRVATGDHPAPRLAGSLAPLLGRLLATDPLHRPEMHQVRDELERLAAVDVETDAWTEEAPGTSPTVPVPPTDRPEPMPAGAGRVAVAPPAPGPTHPLPLRPQEPDPAPSPRRRPLLIGLALLLVGAVAVVALVFSTSGGGVTGATTGPSTGAAPSAGSGSGSASDDGSDSDSPPAPAPGTSEQVAQQQAIVDYYGLIPSDLAAGWERLTPSYQRNTAGGFAGYSQFWGDMSRVTVRGVSPAPGDSVDATVTYTYRDGRTSSERTLFRMVQQDGGWKIDGSQVLSSR
ncbi:serine/threonine-protein kinase [Actinomycetospora sp. NBRC 106378]|uniref:serine/threonine-protein kinase n=1 Tax=Actinomycetospora sp. NBRC 106378 TaxID=3032208 RepID=UPI0024A1AB3F|nr:serine/threonine-protein kinase [Actinomycetospora sp. NBRC 106378]GLZ54379.1 serine/threonine protein kinase [Actinomycetospora sp. NBRC 106378]